MASGQGYLEGPQTLNRKEIEAIWGPDITHVMVSSPNTESNTDQMGVDC